MRNLIALFIFIILLIWYKNLFINSLVFLLFMLGKSLFIFICIVLLIIVLKRNGQNKENI